MTPARFLFTLVACGACTLGLSYAGEASKPPPEQKLREIHATSDRPANRDQPDAKHPLLHNNGRASAWSSHEAPMIIPTKRASAPELHQPGLQKAAVTANGEWIISTTGNHREPLAKRPGGGGSIAPWSGASRRLGAATTGLGGLTAASAKSSAAALDGAAFKRKP